MIIADATVNSDPDVNWHTHSTWMIIMAARNADDIFMEFFKKGVAMARRINEVNMMGFPQGRDQVWLSLMRQLTIESVSEG